MRIRLCCEKDKSFRPLETNYCTDSDNHFKKYVASVIIDNNQ